MAHPLDGLVDSILDSAAARGLYGALPDTAALLGAPVPPDGTVPTSERARNSVVVLRDSIARAESDLRFVGSQEARAVKADEIALLRHRLAAELQAMSRGG